MEKTKNVPRLRFSGFTDDWEHRKFGDVVQRRSEVMTSNDKMPSVEYEDVISEQGVLNKNIYNKKSRKNGIVFTPEDVLYGKLRPYLHNWLNPDFTGIAVGDWWVLKPIAIHKNFLYRILQTPQYDVVANQSAGSKMPRADWSLVSNWKCRVPSSLKEQSRIAGIFDLLDNLITLHQRKLDSIKQYKHGMLQKMFPKEREKMPKIRFPGFTGEWEQCMCKDIFNKVGVPVEVKEGEVYREIGIRSHGKGLFYKDEVTSTELGNKKVFWIEPDCFIVNIVFAWERAVAKTTENEIGMIASHRFPMYKPKAGIVDLDYITKFFTTDQGKRILEMASPGGAGRNRTLGQIEFAESTLLIPSYNEQILIGRLIDDLDATITLHQRKLDQMKLYKQGLLQQMFI